ncbi:hypothetical protein VTN31DRAFT_6489 [Thermomyces dupontii]|uniref:uncharacterized protein n=1 Tax=Talaromyces thermophilus TaxID=28565 RepID=UPI003743612D
MEEDDDDLYEPGDSLPQNQTGQKENGDQPSDAAAKPAEGEEYEVEEEEEDDDDFNIITEAPPDAAPAIPQRHSAAAESQRPDSVDSAAAGAKPSTPAVSRPESASQAKPVATLQSGASYPAIHASNIDVNVDPVHPATGKPIMETDLDADLISEEEKPWRRPGTDLSDYFNYGFDEFTWASYCLKQKELRKEVTDQKKQLEEIQAFLNMGGLPGMPGAPGAPSVSLPGMPGMPGMPDMSQDMMQGMLAGMMSQGMDPSQMDPMSFMQQAQGMMGGQSGGGSQQNQGFGGQGNQQQMGYGGYNQQGGYGRGRGVRRW